MRYVKAKAFAILEIMLATMLLIGLVYLVLHSTSLFHKNQSDQQLGVELSPLISNTIETIAATDPGQLNTSSGGQNLILDASTSNKICPNNTTGLLKNVSSAYLDSMQISGFSLCSAKVVIQPAST